MPIKGPEYGYFVNARKFWLVTKHQFLTKAQKKFRSLKLYLSTVRDRTIIYS